MSFTSSRARTGKHASAGRRHVASMTCGASWPTSRKTDPDEDVRTEAVRGLAGIAAEADNPALAIDAVRQLLELGRLKEIVLVARESSIAEVRAAVVDATRRPAFAGAISRHALDGVSRLHALGRLTDLEELLNVAAQGRTHRCRRRGP